MIQQVLYKKQNKKNNGATKHNKASLIYLNYKHFLLASLILGVSIFIGLILSNKLTVAFNTNKPEQNNQSTKNTDTLSIEQPKFEFYQTLTKKDTKELLITKAPKKEPSTTAEHLKNQSSIIHKHYIQVGCYEDQEVAERNRALYTLNGFQASIDSKNGKNKVLVGPYSNMDKLNIDKDKISNMSLTDSILIITK